MKTKFVLAQMARLNGEITTHYNRYSIIYKGNAISFIDQNGHALCLRVRALGDQDDLISDYHAGSFVKTWKQVMRLVRL